MPTKCQQARQVGGFAAVSSSIQAHPETRQKWEIRVWGMASASKISARRSMLFSVTLFLLCRSLPKIFPHLEYFTIINRLFRRDIIQLSYKQLITGIINSCWKRVTFQPNPNVISLFYGQNRCWQYHTVGVGGDSIPRGMNTVIHCHLNHGIENCFPTHNN